MVNDGNLSFNTKIDTSGFDKGKEKISQTAKATGEEVEKAADETKNKIQSILNDTERSTKSKAASIAGIYRKQGLSQSSAMEKAWTHIKRGSADINGDMVRHSKQASEKISQTAKATGKSVTNSYGGAGNKISSTFKKIAMAAATAFSVYKIVDFGKQAIETTSNLKEVQNVVDTAFGGMSKKMENFADTAIESYGISKLTAKQTGSTFMAMASGMGIAIDTASDMSLSLTGLSADISSFYNIQQDVASTALKSIFTGETETLKQFGIVMTDANLQAYALSQGITKSTSAMTQAEKVQLRYGFVMQQTALAQGDFAKTSGSWANQTRILSEKWNEFAGTVGNVLLKVLLPIIEKLNDALSLLVTWAETAAQAVGLAFGETSGAVTSATNGFSSASEAVDDISDSQTNLTTAVEDETEAQKKQNKQLAGFDKLNVMQDTAEATNPKKNVASEAVTIAPAIEQSSTAIDKTNKGLFKMSDLINDVVNKFNLAPLVKKFKDFGKKLWEQISKYDFGSALMSTLTNAIKFVVSVLNLGAGIVFPLAIALDIPGIVYEGLESLSQLFDMLGQIVDSVTPGIENFVNIGLVPIATWVGGKIKDGLQFLQKLLKKIGDWFSEHTGQFTEIGKKLGVITKAVWEFLEPFLNNCFEIGKKQIEALIDFILNCVGAGINVFEGWLDVITGLFSGDFSQIQEGFSKIWNGIIEQVKSVGILIWTLLYNALIKPIMDFCMVACGWLDANLIQPVISVFTGLWDSICGIFGTAWTWFDENVIQPIVWVFSPIVDSVSGFFSETWDDICSVFSSVGTFFSEKFSEAWDGITSAFTNVKKFFEEIWDKITSVFTDVGTAVGNAFGDGVKSVVNTILSWVENTINFFINGINGVIGLVNAIPGVDISEITPLEIPRLATGTVVPANFGEFTAILGDNKREPEIVSPLSTMKQALKEALRESGYGAGGNAEYTFVAQLDGKTIFKEVVKQNELDKKRRGGRTILA